MFATQVDSPGLAEFGIGRGVPKRQPVLVQSNVGPSAATGPTVHDEAQMPFGGVKASGWGRFGGLAGVHEFTDLRWITVQTEERHYPF